MENKIKSGKEIVEDFFKELQTLDGVDKQIISELTRLYEIGKLNDSNIRKILDQLRSVK